MYFTLLALYTGYSTVSLKLFEIRRSVPKGGEDLGKRMEPNQIQQERMER